MNTEDALGDEIVVFRSDRAAGHRMPLNLARSHLGDATPAIVACHVAAFFPGSVVEFWTPATGRHWVANPRAGLEGATREQFIKRARSITEYLPDAPCGDCRAPPPTPSEDDDGDDGEDDDLPTFVVRLSGDPIVPYATFSIKAIDHADAQQRFLSKWSEYEEEAWGQAMESIEAQAQDIEFLGTQDMIDEIVLDPDA